MVAASQGRITFTATTGQRVKMVAASQGRVTFTATTAQRLKLPAASVGRITFTATSNGIQMGPPSEGFSGPFDDSRNHGRTGTDNNGSTGVAVTGRSKARTRAGVYTSETRGKIGVE